VRVSAAKEGTVMVTEKRKEKEIPGRGGLPVKMWIPARVKVPLKNSARLPLAAKKRNTSSTPTLGVLIHDGF
jgi:hypothetical protein